MGFSIRVHDSLNLQPGSLFVGEFRIIRRLSGGGMGAVYVAEQQSTGVDRALKVMHPELVKDDRLRERFEQEARVGARIQSDHVVQVIGAGVEEKSGTPWIAMELLDGQSLASFVGADGCVVPADALRIFRQLCHALGAAHDVGIVHRDLKPENVFLAVSRHAFEDFTVKVLDYGIAKVIAEAKTTVTDALGTPLWMAPEQAELGGKISSATDVWALGLLAYWMLTGREYWKTAAEDSPNVPAILREILFDPVDPPSQRAADLGSEQELPAGFDEWFAQCVTRMPEQRFKSANEAFAELEPILQDAAGEPIPDRLEPTSGGRLSVRSGEPARSRRQDAEAATLVAHWTGRVDSAKGKRRWPWLVVAAVLFGAASFVIVPTLRARLPASVRQHLPAISATPANVAPPATPTPEPAVPSTSTVETPDPEPEREQEPRAELEAGVGGPRPDAGVASATTPSPGKPSTEPGAPRDPRAGGGGPGPGAGPVEEPTDPEPPTSAEPPKPARPFPQSEANAAVRSAAASASSCHSGQEAKVTVMVVWGNGGAPRAITVSNAPPGAQACIRAQFAQKRIAPFDGTATTTRVTFQL